MSERVKMGIGECFICQRYGPTERHHIFGASNRKLSEKYGLVVHLCHDCHNEPPDGVHHCRATREKLQRFGQRKAMAENGWSEIDFRRVFGKNYLDERALDIWPDENELEG